MKKIITSAIIAFAAVTAANAADIPLKAKKAPPDDTAPSRSESDRIRFRFQVPGDVRFGRALYPLPG